jgi:hypothetical protein
MRLPHDTSLAHYFVGYILCHNLRGLLRGCAELEAKEIISCFCALHSGFRLPVRASLWVSEETRERVRHLITVVTFRLNGDCVAKRIETIYLAFRLGLVSIQSYAIRGFHNVG